MFFIYMREHKKANNGRNYLLLHSFSGWIVVAFKRGCSDHPRQTFSNEIRMFANWNEENTIKHDVMNHVHESAEGREVHDKLL